MQIWPAVEIRSGKCVRLGHGDYQPVTVYGESPADMAIRWVNDGARGLLVVDLDGTIDETPRNIDAISQIVRQTEVPIVVGGGIGDELTIEKYISIGIQRIVIGARAIENPLWAIEIVKKHPGQIIVAVNSRNGLRTPGSQLNTTTPKLIDFAQQMANYPIAGILLTDVAKQGKIEVPDYEALKQLRDAVNVPVIASGDISKADDVLQLAALNLDGCVIGRALYEGRLTLADSLRAAKTGRDQAQATAVEDASPASQHVSKGPHFRSIRKSSGASTP